MTCKIILNSVGLLIGVVGSTLIWIFGLPASVDRTGAEYRATGNVDEHEVALAKKFDCKSRIGFLMLILSFLFQLISNFL
ncbi:MAG TPA: hypothetical protein VIK59_10695 [Verrucomicrobiae bacterium]